MNLIKRHRSHLGEQRHLPGQLRIFKFPYYQFLISLAKLQERIDFTQNNPCHIEGLIQKSLRIGGLLFPFITSTWPEHKVLNFI